MKLKLLTLGCWVMLIYMSGCSKTDEVSLTGIGISPTTFTIDAGKTMDLSATITPSNATEDVFWFSLDQKIVSLDNRYGIQTKLNALSPGTTTVYATNRMKTVVSENITITVSSVDFVKDITGDYLGSGSLKWAIATINEELTDVIIHLERAYDEEANEYYMDRVKLTIIAETEMMGHAVITGERILVSSAYELSNENNLKIEGVTGASFDELTGRVDPVGKTITLRLFMNNGITIELTAKKQE